VAINLFTDNMIHNQSTQEATHYSLLSNNPVTIVMYVQMSSHPYVLIEEQSDARWAGN